MELQQEDDLRISEWQAREDAHVWKMSEPFFLTNLIVYAPVYFSCCIYSALFFVAIIIIANGWLEPNILTQRDYFVWGTEVVNGYDKLVLIEQESNRAGGEVADL